MFRPYLLLLLFILLPLISKAQHKDLTVQRNGLTFPNGKELTDPINAKMDIPPGGTALVVYAEIAGISGDATATFCQQCISVYAFDSYSLRPSPDGTAPGPFIEEQFFVLSKKATGASDQLLDLYRLNANIPSVAIKLFNIDGNGIVSSAYTVEILNAKIAEYRLDLEYDAENGDYTLLEKYYFFYRTFSFKQGSEQAVILE